MSSSSTGSVSQNADIADVTNMGPEISVAQPAMSKLPADVLAAASEEDKTLPMPFGMPTAKGHVIVVWEGRWPGLYLRW